MIYVSDGVDITTDQVQTEHVTRMIFGHYTDTGASLEEAQKRQKRSQIQFPQTNLYFLIRPSARSSRSQVRTNTNTL